MYVRNTAIRGLKIACAIQPDHGVEPISYVHLLWVALVQSVGVSVRFRESVESCERWANSTTQQVDLAFNIFFMIYFFIRVGDCRCRLHDMLYSTLVTVLLIDSLYS